MEINVKNMWKKINSKYENAKETLLYVAKYIFSVCV